MPTPVTPEQMRTALDVRRGLLRLKDVAEADRAVVHGILRRATDAQMAVLAESQERRGSRASRMIPRHPGQARSL